VDRYKRNDKKLFFKISKIKKKLGYIKIIVCFADLETCKILVFLPNHSADAFDPPQGSCTSRIDCLLRWILDGFRKWDAIYFHFISVNGYIFENTLAFFPLFPIFLRLISSLTYTLVPLWSFWTHSILVGVVFNFFCSLLCAIQMYRLSKLIFVDDSLSVVSALLFVINPASVFFTTLYSEALYSLLFLSALIWLHDSSYVTGCIILSMTVFCRSNGLVNCGFPCFFQFVLLVNRLRSLYKESRRGSAQHMHLPILPVTVAVFHCFLSFLATFLCVSSPYLIYQYYAGFLYCFLANELEVLTPYSVNSSFKPLWCAGVPWSSYMLLQKKFWDVGIFTYYQWKQLPNFLLALPVLILVFKSVSLFGRKAPKTLLSLGILGDHGKQRLVVLTRMLFSSCPVLYWYCASVLLNEQDNVFGHPPWSYQRALLYYFYSYIVIGCLMHSNFLPWT
ncbi:unnamed protein product, partial [Taenia asiatica]|uniref:GPI mannosyltransferase 2 n=1 Tax=Taenia asiatica TaxID=60517 RepID=A0A0R3WBD1_TAEAS